MHADPAATEAAITAEPLGRHFEDAHPLTAGLHPVIADALTPHLNAALIPAGNATCPKCGGSTRRPAPENAKRWRLATYREIDDTLACDNCGGQTMSLTAKGYTRVDPATGLGCLHQFRGQNAGRCYTVYTCARCQDRYDIDSGD